jgi:membrane protein
VAFLKGIRNRVQRHQVSMIAASLAYYALLALFPSIIAMVTVWALVSDPDQVKKQLDPVVRTMPEDVGNLVTTQLTHAAQANHGGLTIGLVASLLGTLWAASGGIAALLRGLSMIFDTTGESGFVKQRATSLGLTVGAIIAAIVSLALVAAFPVVLRHVGLGPAGRVGAEVLRWVLLFLFIAAALAVLYRIAGNKPEDRWLFVSVGVLVAVLLWIAASVGFSIYVSNFGKYNATYGSIGAVIVLLLWLYLSAFAILLGAVVDAEFADRRVAASPA